MFGTDKLVGEGGAPVEVASLEGKHVLLYFSAHWCPPCRGFTPELAKYYKQHAENKNFEIVFVSSDRDQASFDEYFAEMPWKALPFDMRDKKNELSKKCKVNGIPSLCVFSPDGELITVKGRAGVSGDPECNDFPWAPKSVAQILDGAELQGGGSLVDAVAGKVHAFYFSAHWCPPCKAFTPQLADTYKKLNEAGKPFEIVFVSSDRDQASFDEYFAEMPWKALKFEDRGRKAELSDAFDVEGIPSLIIFDENGKKITDDGRSAVGGDPEGAEFPWYPKPLNDLAAGPGAINDLPSLIVFSDGADEATQAKVKEDMTAIAEAHWAEAEQNGGEPAFAFFTAVNSDGISSRVRELACVTQSGNEVKVVMLDIPAGGMHFHSDLTATSAEALTDFMKNYKTFPNAKLGTAPGS
jgi:nucleoredoxin